MSHNAQPVTENHPAHRLEGRGGRSQRSPLWDGALAGRGCPVSMQAAALLPQEVRAEVPPGPQVTPPLPRGWGTPCRGAGPLNSEDSPRVPGLAGWDSV